MNQPRPAPASGWRYPDTGATRDLRIDFMRGFVFVMLFTSHFPGFSWMALVGWERFGVVSSAETFIGLAGYVTGAVYSKRLAQEGLSSVATRLFARAWTLYKIAFLVTASVALLRLLPGLDLQELTTFTNPVTREVFPLYPPTSMGFMANLLHVVMLRAGPHQFQVIGLYVALFLLTPIIFWALDRGRTGSMLVLSFGVWLLNFLWVETTRGTAQLRLTGSQFEYAFPLVAWQFIFVCGVVLGYWRRGVFAFFRTGRGRALLVACFIASLGFMLFTLNHPLAEIPAWARLQWIDPGRFNAWYEQWFRKYNLGPGRLLNNAVLLPTVFALLTIAWRPVERALAWLFIPLGQESMYVFFVHVYLILLVSNLGLDRAGALVNTAVQVGALLLCWVMVKTRFLFRWIPR